MMSLAKLIAHNLYVSTWLFKIDDEFNGRGHASFTVDTVKYIVDLRRKKVEITDGIIERLIEILSKMVPKKTAITMPSLHPTWNDFVSAFCNVGGVIEAAPSCLSTQIGSPSISFFIQPDGEVSVTGSYDRFPAKEYANAGCFFP